MLNKALQILEPLLLTILDTTPSGVIIHMGRSSQWMIDNFEIVWMNKAARKLLGHVSGTGQLVPTSEANRKIIQASLDELQSTAQENEMHHTEFIGPFQLASRLSDGRDVQLGYSLMYAGKIANGLPVVLQVTHERPDSSA